MIVSCPPLPPALQQSLRGAGYQVVQQLGQGAIGVVVEAQAIHGGATVALKLLRPELAERTDLLALFKVEAEVGQRLRHPAIAAVHRLEVSPAGTAFLVMERVLGESLGASLRKRRLFGSLPRVAAQVAAALAHAHEHGVVHRDLKPENILLTPDSRVLGGLRTKVIDFGLARLDAHSEPAPSPSRPLIMGTPTYMAPEQCVDANQADDRADVYALGVILYEALAGRPPFQARGESAVRRVMGMQMFVAPQPLAELAPDADCELVRLVHAMLNKVPGQRPPMRQVVSVLELLAADCTELVPRSSPGSLIPMEPSDL